MALSQTGVIEVRAGGSDSNSGYFNPSGSSPGTDYTLQDAAQCTIDGVSITATVQATTTQVQIGGLSAPSVATWNRNSLRITGGAMTAGLYEIVAVNSGTGIITLDRSAGTAAQTGTGAMGGALASPGQAGVYTGTNNGLTVFVKYNATPFTATSASTNVSGGCVNNATGTTFVGYDTTRTIVNVDANRPTFKIGASVSSANLFAGTGSQVVRNFILDGNSQTSSRGFFARGIVVRCLAQNCTTAGIADNGSQGTAVAQYCAATACAIGFDTLSAFYCDAYSNTTSGFSSCVYAVNCVAYGNTGATVDGFVNVLRTVNCVAYGNGREGFRYSAANGTCLNVNCVAEGNSGYGYNVTTGSSLMALVNCASYNNTSGRSNTGGYPIADQGAITGSGSFFTNAAGGVFTLNNTAGAGALLRAAGFPATSADGLTASYADVGSAQHQDSGASGMLYRTGGG